MKKALLALLLTIGFTFNLNAEELILGDPVTKGSVQSVATIMEQPDDFVGKKVTIKGKITKVCKKRGCWADFVANDKQLRVKVADGEIEIPLHTIGKEAYATGVLNAKELTKKQTIAYLKHMASDAGEKFDVDSVKKGMTLYQLQSNAVKIL